MADINGELFHSSIANTFKMVSSFFEPKFFNELQMVNKFMIQRYDTKYSEAWFNTVAANPLKVHGEMLSFLNRAMFEGALKGAWMTDVLNFERKGVPTPEQFEIGYAGRRYFSFMERGFNQTHPVEQFWPSDFKLTDSFDGMYSVF